MKNFEDLIHQLVDENRQQKEQNQQLVEENKLLKGRLDIALNQLALLTEENQYLKDEIAILKGQKPRPKIPPSSLEGAHSKDKEDKKKNKNRVSRGKHPRRKKTNLEIHAKNRIKPESIPEGAIFKGCQRFTVQDIILQPCNTIYELERWLLPNGTYISGKLPTHIHGHYGPKLVSYILDQYYGCRVTEGLLLAQLREIGILMSAGQLSNILIQNKESFHQEKDELLSAGIAATGQIKVDDTGARHDGQNGYSTIIGNEYFTYIVSTDSKSRINFFEILHGSDPRYLINEDAVAYIETIKPLSWLGGHLFVNARDSSMNSEEFKQFLLEGNIVSENDVRLVTEATLFAHLINKGVPKDLGVHGDDAGQFDAFVRSLCWIHEERHYRKLIACDEKMREVIEEIRGKIWDLYRGLLNYKLNPSTDLKLSLEREFDNLFLNTETISPTLNKQLRKTYEKKEKLLRVLERPETPLHNNGTETDAREMVVKRKVSGGTRSETGKRSRDTFISLKKTCIKLGINFWNYLGDRVSGTFTIPRLAQIISMRSAKQAAGP